MHACYKIPQENMYQVEKKLAKLNRRGGDLRLRVVAQQLHRYNDPERYQGGNGEINASRLYNWVELEGTSPVVEGYEFLGRVEDGLILEVPGKHIPQHYYNAAPDCDHCNKKRSRKRLYIVCNTETGEIMQVGNSCLADFLRSKTAAHDMAAYFTRVITRAIEILEEDYSVSPSWGWAEYEETERLLARTASVVRVKGWVSRKAADKAAERDEYLETTAGVVYSLMFGRSNNDSKLRDKIGPVIDQDREFAEAAQNWLADQDSEGNNYIHNLKVLLTEDHVDARRFGIACSLIGTYHRYLDKQAEKAAEVIASAPVPETDKRIQVCGTIVKIDYKEGYGYNAPDRRVATVLDDRGFKVWGTMNDGDTGDRVEFMARVNPSDRDNTFGFFKRPTKMRILDNA